MAQVDPSKKADKLYAGVEVRPSVPKVIKHLNEGSFKEDTIKAYVDIVKNRDYEWLKGNFFNEIKKGSLEKVYQELYKDDSNKYNDVFDEKKGGSARSKTKKYLYSLMSPEERTMRQWEDAITP